MPEASPWELAWRAARRAGVTLVPYHDLEDAERVRHVIERVWGEQVLPREMIRAFQYAGGVLYGARVEDEDVGFVLGFAGLDRGVHLHSHMLGVVPGRQDHGVGYALKLAQRAACLDAGVEEIRWTYDPLQARNARFNLVKLGTVATGLLRNFYGAMQDRINAGDRSDRFEIRWDLRSDRVGRALDGRAAGPGLGPAVLDAIGTDGWPEPKPTGADPEPGATVAVPVELTALKAGDPGLARRWRDAVADACETCFAAGLQATWFTPEGRYVFQSALREEPS